jgi:hypothetical protein
MIAVLSARRSTGTHAAVADRLRAVLQSAALCHPPFSILLRDLVEPSKEVFRVASLDLTTMLAERGGAAGRRGSDDSGEGAPGEQPLGGGIRYRRTF